jgi:hypothetical protein
MIQEALADRIRKIIAWMVIGTLAVAAAAAVLWLKFYVWRLAHPGVEWWLWLAQGR